MRIAHMLRLQRSWRAHLATTKRGALESLTLGETPLLFRL